MGRDPSAQEDVERQIFPNSHPALTAFQAYWDAAGVHPSEVVHTNSVSCHGFRDRKPLTDEVRTCRMYRVWELAAWPTVNHLFVLGGDAFYSVFGDIHGAIVRNHGCRFQIDVQGRLVSVLSVYHPWYVRFRDALFVETLQILSEYRQRWMT